MTLMYITVLLAPIPPTEHVPTSSTPKHRPHLLLGTCSASYFINLPVGEHATNRNRRVEERFNPSDHPCRSLVPAVPLNMSISDTHLLRASTLILAAFYRFDVMLHFISSHRGEAASPPLQDVPKRKGSYMRCLTVECCILQLSSHSRS
jgi:hypothetical protein